MSGKKTTRVALDVALTAMIIAEMFIQFTGVLLHEVIGFAFFATVAVHLALSAKWIKSTAGAARKGSMGKRRAALAVVGTLLAVNMVVLGISSIAISTILEGAGLVWTLGSYTTWSAIHAASSYALCALVTVHLCMHWAFLASAFRVPYDPSRRKAIDTGVRTVAAVGALALGAVAVNQAMPIVGAGSIDAAAQASAAEAPETTSSASSGSGSASIGSDASERSGGKGKKGKGLSGATGTTGATGTPSTSGTSAQGSNATTESSDGGESSIVSGICTLCHKQCPLSAPQCDKPYREGLL